MERGGEKEDSAGRSPVRRCPLVGAEALVGGVGGAHHSIYIQIQIGYHGNNREVMQEKRHNPSEIFPLRIIVFANTGCNASYICK